MVYKTVCRDDGCCQVGVEEDSGVEIILSCTRTWPNIRVD